MWAVELAKDVDPNEIKGVLELSESALLFTPLDDRRPGKRIPVAIDTDYDGNPSRYRHVPESFRAAHWGSAPDGTPDESLVASLKGAIRDARRKEIA